MVRTCIFRGNFLQDLVCSAPVRALRDRATLLSGGPQIRKDLNADALIQTVRSGFEALAEHRTGAVDIPLADALMSAFAMFSLKDPSLLAFEKRRDTDPNLRAIYRLGKIPSDTNTRPSTRKRSRVS